MLEFVSHPAGQESTDQDPDPAGQKSTDPTGSGSDSSSLIISPFWYAGLSSSPLLIINQN